MCERDLCLSGQVFGTVIPHGAPTAGAALTLSIPMVLETLR